MTPLRKSVKRRTVNQYRVLYNQPREIVVTLRPGDIIEFREAGRRQSYSLAINTAFSYALKLHADALLRAKKEARKLRKAGRNG